MSVCRYVLAVVALLAVSPLFVYVGVSGAGDVQAQERRDTVRMRLDTVIVASTRTGRRIEDEPLRVEVVGREEIEEKLLMTPGDIAMLLNETGGVRVQQTSPVSGGAAVRVQGLRGRYTQILADGLPLYGEAAGIGPLQIPPMDLRQVEVIKGAASALYGPSALGGVINLLSRGPDGEREALLNVTSRDGQDAVVWLASGLADGGGFGWTLLAGGHRQERVDVAGDGWADIPSHARGTVRPRLHVRRGRTTFMVTAGAMTEERSGGMGDIVSSLRQGLDTDRVDAGLVGTTWTGGMRLDVRASAMEQRHARRFDDRTERDRSRTAFAEAALSGAAGAHTWVAGIALRHDGYRNRDVSGFDESATSPGLFVQDEWMAVPWATLAASARIDHFARHGTLASPRLSVLLRPGDWSVRLSAGGGHHTPSHRIEEVDAIGLGALAGPSDLAVERARATSLDVGREFGEIEVNATLFASVIEDALALLESDAGPPRVVNLPDRTRTHGGELLARAHIDPLHITASYAYTRATEPSPEGSVRRDVELTPSHTAGVVAAWEMEDRGRIGVEVYYTGRQALYGNPYRATSRPYTLVGVLVERRFGPARVFVNFENIGDVRQTRWDPLLLPSRDATGRWTTEAWAPLDGRVINGGVRLGLP